MKTGGRLSLSGNTVAMWMAGLGLAASQAVPTWGGVLGHVGNWIPFVASGILLVASAVMLLVLRGRMAQPVRHVALLYFLVLPTIAAIGALVSPLGLADLEDLAADYFRFFLVGSAFYVGYELCRHDPRRVARVIFAVLLLGVGLNLVLFILFLSEPWNVLAQLYSTRTMGGTKFPGSWNYPYNLSVFLSLVIAFFGAAVASRVGVFRQLGAFVVLSLALVMLVAAQSRAGLIAFLVAVPLTFLAVGLADSFRGRSISGLKNLMVFSGLGGGSVLLGWFLISHVDYRWADYYSAISEIGGDDPRLQQAQWFAEELGEYPLGLLIGFGPSREFPVWLENFLVYFQRYGFLGFSVIVFYPLMIAAWAAWKLVSVRGDRVARAVGFAGIFFLMFFSLNFLTSNILFHFRFVGLGFFVLGFYVALASPGVVGRLSAK